MGIDSRFASYRLAVPKGSALVPLLFLLCINDLNQAIKLCKVHPFADGNTLLYLGESIKNLYKLVNFDLKTLLYWLSTNKTSLNV